MHHDEIQKLKKILAEDSNDDVNISNALKEIFKKTKEHYYDYLRLRAYLRISLSL